MKTPTLLLALAALATSPALPAQELRCNPAGSQQEMNVCARDDFKAADAELNRVWRKVRQRHRDNPLFPKLQEAQRLWIQMRDAELEAMFPIEAGQNRELEYGSMYPLLYHGAKTQLTKARTQHLRDHYLSESAHTTAPNPL